MRTKKHTTGRTILFVLLALVLIAVIAAAGIYIKIKNYNTAFDPESSKTVDFVVPKGSSTSWIANHLEEAGLIKSAEIFRFKAKFNKLDGKFQAGEYEFGAYMTTEEIMAKLQDAKRETTKITIKEGWKIADIAAYLEENKIVSKSDFYESLENDEFDQWFVPMLSETSADPTGEISAKANRFEGFLFPETYEIYVGASARSIINKMLSQFAKEFDESIIADAEKLGLNLQELITVASLIENETVIDKERPLVSSVIYNRLNTNATNKMLQLDCTVLYALGYHKTRVLYKDLEIDSPYNTYKYPGLPIGPICSPGKACIDAALNPAQTDYLYYVANSSGDGSHKFSKSYKQHIQNSQDYYNSLK